MRHTPENFLGRTRAARKVMVLDLGFLGDTVHLLPALWMVRRAYPQAKLHVAVAAHVMSFMVCVPWVDQVWGYMRFPRHATLRENWQMITGLRREKFDALINLNGSDRSSWLTFFSGASERLGREPSGGGPPFWRRMFTEIVRYPFMPEPIYVQKCRCLEKAGFPSAPPEFHVSVDPAQLSGAGITPAEFGTYFHLSPFTTDDVKELPPEQLAALISALETQFPGKQWVVSCAPTQRELDKLDALLKLLPRKPWRVFAGNLNLMQLASVIQHSAMHLCGDTGTLHLALMTGTPSVSWFWPNPGRGAWVSPDDRCRIIVGRNEPGARYLCGIETDGLVRAVHSVLDVMVASSNHSPRPSPLAPANESCL